MRPKRFFPASLLSLALAVTPPVSFAVSLDRLDEKERALLQSTVKGLDPLITERKKEGTAPLITFEQLYRPLTPKQIAFLEEFRQLDPATLGGSSRKLPAPTGREEFVQLNRQVILKEGKPIRLDTQYLPRPVYEAYQRMMAAMETDLGKRFLVESGYRSPAYQLYLFLFYMPKHGYSIRETNRHVALPGCSEHGSPPFQAIDFITPEGINGEDRPEEFEELQGYGWLQARAHEFGFHLSYPRTQKGSGRPGTSAAFEPWHWHWEGGQTRRQEKTDALRESQEDLAVLAIEEQLAAGLEEPILTELAIFVKRAQRELRHLRRKASSRLRMLDKESARSGYLEPSFLTDTTYELSAIRTRYEILEYELPRILAEAKRRRFLIARNRINEAADNTEAIRDHVLSGRSGEEALYQPPPGSHVRKSAEEVQTHLEWLHRLEDELRKLEGKLERQAAVSLKEPTELQVKEAIRKLQGTSRRRIATALDITRWIIPPDASYGGLLLEALVKNLQHDNLEVSLAAQEALGVFAEILPPGALRQELALRVLVDYLRYGTLPLFHRLANVGLYTDSLFTLALQAYPSLERGFEPATYVERLRREMFGPVASPISSEPERMVRKVDFSIDERAARHLGFPQKAWYWHSLPARHAGDLLGLLEIYEQLPADQIPPPGPLTLGQDLGFSLWIFKALRAGTLRLELDGRPLERFEAIFPTGGIVVLTLSAGLEELLDNLSGFPPQAVSGKLDEERPASWVGELV